MVETATAEWVSLPRQWEFLQSRAKEVLFSGAYGAGKTVTLCRKTVMQASIPRARVGLGRKTLKALKGSTRVTLLEGGGTLDPVLPKGYYTYHKTDNEIRIRGGGTIVLFGIDHPETLGSYPFECVYIDEGTEMTEDDWVALLGRCRGTAGPLRQLGAACNPSNPEHFLAKRFGIGNHIALPNTHLIQTCSSDNWHLPQDYLEHLNTLTGVHKARYVQGQWVGFEGVIYDEFSYDAHLKEMARDWDEIQLWIDQGAAAPSVCSVVGIWHRDGEEEIRRPHVVECFYEAGTRPTQFLTTIVDLAHKKRGLKQRQYEPICIVDPSAAGLIADLRAADLCVIGADNAVLDGIRRVKSYLNPDRDGGPLLTFDPSCTDIFNEFGAYIWKGKGKDEPVKQMDHAMDETRYGCMYLGPVTGTAPLHISSLGDDEEDQLKEEGKDEVCVERTPEEENERMLVGAGTGKDDLWVKH